MCASLGSGHPLANDFRVGRTALIFNLNKIHQPPPQLDIYLSGTYCLSTRSNPRFSIIKSRRFPDVVRFVGGRLSHHARSPTFPTLTVASNEKNNH
jgi:hypothetical protein